MHELSITESVVQTVRDRLGEQKVIRVQLEIGALSGVVADAVKFCFELVTDGTTLDGARLEVVRIPGLGRCRDCGAEVELRTLLDVCPCGGGSVDVIGGEQLRIKEVEVAA